MKEFYQIHELAKLCHLCADTLRYYEEKGLLHPTRGENRYRMYSVQDICTLNIIRGLRDLGMPLEEIRGALERRSVAETLALLDTEEELLRSRMEELEHTRREVESRRARLLTYGGAAAGQVAFRREAARPYVALRQDIIMEGEIDFLLKKLESRHQDAIKIMGSQCMGALVDGKSLASGVYNHFACVFFLVEPERPCDAELPAGEYASLYYRGAYTALEEHYRTLLAGVAASGRHPVVPPLELYRIDVHDTRLEAEYVTELQMRVEG